MAERSDRQVFVGVDVGGTKIGVNGIDGDRVPLSPHWLEVESRSHVGPRATVEQIVLGLQRFVERERIPLESVAGVGLDSPGPADINGKIEKSANMHADWEGFELCASAQSAISAALGRPVHVQYENDCNAAALWESFVGCPAGNEIMVLLAPGTGLGGGIVIDGRLVRGARGMGGELGHIEIVHPPFAPGAEPQCGCGQKYCAEAYASLAAMARLLPAALQQPQWRNHPLNDVQGGDDVWRRRAFQVRGLAAKGDALALAIFDWQSQAIGNLCRQVADAVDPHRFVIGGGFIEGGPELTDRVMKNVRETFQRLSFKKHAAEVKFETAKAADQAGCLGAALSAWGRANARSR